MFFLMAVLIIAGCATTPAVGSKKWHDSRLIEIETAYENDEISMEVYLTLKSEADLTRVEHQETMKKNTRARRSNPFPHRHGFGHRR